MFHQKRTWGPPRRVETPEELSELLSQHTWTLCSAFEHAGYLYLNDSLSENGAQEYAVLKRLEDGFQQIESITFGWCTEARALERIQKVSSGAYDVEGGSVAPRIDPPGHRCGLCM